MVGRSISLQELDDKYLAIEREYETELQAAFHSLELAAARTPIEGSFAQGSSFKAQGGTSLQAARLSQLYVKLGIPLSFVIEQLLEA